MLGGNSSTLAFVNSFRPDGQNVTARLLPIAWTPVGVVIGEDGQNLAIPLDGVVDWVDRTFAPEDERSFIAPMRDIELLARVEWQAPQPKRLDEAAIINIDDLPEDVAEGLANPPAPIVQCGACRRLSVRGEFLWKDRQLCAWDYHAQVFGKRGPWREGAYHERHFATLPSCAYVAAALLAQLDVEVILALDGIEEAAARTVVNALLEAEPQRAHLAVRTAGKGIRVLRERT